MNAQVQSFAASCTDSRPGAVLSLDFDQHHRRLVAHPVQLLLKRVLDIVVSLALLVLSAPVFILAALTIKWSSPGPVLFRQEREGRGGCTFQMLKFRSMRTETPQEWDQRQAAAGVHGTLVKLRDDPRVTPVGKILRRTSIDELPQLLNVLRGDMSLVGPRPLIPFMLAAHPEFRRIRALVRPGISGLWQLRDRENNTTAAAMLPHDLEYIENFSVRLDAGILLRTIPVVLTGKGAF